MRLEIQPTQYNIPKTKNKIYASTALENNIVSTEGVEPTRCLNHQILSLTRLPIPPR